MGLKIAVVGGGSTYTPELVEGLADRTDRLPGRRARRSSTSTASGWRSSPGCASGSSAARAGPGRLTTTTDRDAGDRRGRLRPRPAPGRRPGGPAPRRDAPAIGSAASARRRPGRAGFAKALRTVPVVLELAEEVGPPGARRAPGSSTSRTRSGSSPRRCSTRATGRSACATWRSASSAGSPPASGSTPERVELEHVGLNHLTWVRAVRVDGVDRLPELLDERRRGAGRRASSCRSSSSGRSARCPPTTCATTTRPREVARGAAGRPDPRRGGHGRSSASCSSCTATRPSIAKPALLEQRGGAFYSEAAAQLIASLHAGTGDVQVVDVRNDGALPDLPADAVVEVPARIDRDGAHPLPLAPLAPEMRGLVQHAKAYEELAIAGGRHRRPADRPPGAPRQPARARPPRRPRACSTRSSR